MRKLKLAILLPTLQCTLEVATWHSRHVWTNGPIYEDGMPPMDPAASLSFGLNAPAELLMLLVNDRFDWLAGVFWPQRIGTFPAAEFTLLVVFTAIVWWVIGNWFDLRSRADYTLKHTRLTLPRAIARLFLLTLGTFFLLFSLNWPVSSFTATIARALLQTWAIFLFAGPSMALMRWLNQRRERGITARSARSISGF